MRWLRAVVPCLLVSVWGCHSVVAPTEFQRVLAEMAPQGYATSFQTNPRVDLLSGGRVRLRINTYHACQMQFSDPTITRDGNRVGIILYEVRGPCDGGRNGYEGEHDIMLEFLEEGEASVEILAMYFNRPATFTELFDIDFSRGDSDATGGN